MLNNINKVILTLIFFGAIMMKSSCSIVIKNEFYLTNNDVLCKIIMMFSTT